MGSLMSNTKEGERKMKLTYWVCICLDDSKSYNIRAKTRREAKVQRTENGEDGFSSPKKVTVNYDNAFDLIYQALGEGGIE